MLNPQNLTPIKSHERAVNLGRKGGSVKSAKKRWINIKYCTQRCGFYGLCPFMTASITSPDKLCALKQRKVKSGGREVAIQQEIIESFFALFENNGQGFLKEVLKSVYKLRFKNQDASTAELHKYIHILIDVKKAFYGDG